MKNNSVKDNFCGWASRQVDHLRAGNFNAVDTQAIVEVLLERIGEKVAEMRMALRDLLVSLFDWAVEPDHRTLENTRLILRRRNKLSTLLDINPSLIDFLHRTTWFESVWQDAVYEASIQFDRPVLDFPESPLWTIYQIRNVVFLPETSGKLKVIHRQENEDE